MKNILVLVMVLFMSGCDEDGNIKTIHQENYDEILEVQEQTNEASNKLDLILDRLDTIDMNIDRIEAETMNNTECVIDMLDEVFDGISNDIEWVEGMVYDKDNQVVSIYRSDGTLSIEFAIYEIYDSWCN